MLRDAVKSTKRRARKGHRQRTTVRRNYNGQARAVDTSIALACTLFQTAVVSRINGLFSAPPFNGLSGKHKRAGSDIATSRALLKQKPRQLKAFLMAITEGTYIGRTQKEVALRIYRKYLKIEDPKMLDSMHKNYLLGSIPARPFPNEEAIQNDIEDLSSSYPHLKGRRAAEFLDISLLKSMEDEGFFKKLYGK